MYNISGTVCNWSLVDKTERRLMPFLKKKPRVVLNGWPIWINILNHIHVRYMKYLKFGIYSKIWNFELEPHLHHPKFQLHKDVVHSNLNFSDSSHGFWVELHYLLSGIYTEQGFVRRRIRNGEQWAAFFLCFSFITGIQWRF